MSSSGQEREAKFYLSDLNALEARLINQGAALVQPRTHEYNLRFDTPDRQLTRASKVLRLRRDHAVHLTYKGPGKKEAGVISRREIEFTAGEFESAQSFLEALGFQVTIIYEKYRATYALVDVQVMLDEMPFGHFAEIEGPNVEAIQSAAARLGLDWEAHLPNGYLAIFEKVCQKLNLQFRDLTFDNFRSVTLPEGLLGFPAADLRK